MIKRTLAEIAAMVGGRLSDPAMGNIEICGVSRDSRALARGNLYVPLAGDNFDGHEFAANALSRGAAAALWQHGRANAPQNAPLVFVDDTLTALQRLAAEYRRQLGVKVVGITGSNGKTTTKDLTAAVLAAAFRVHKTEGNYNNHIGLPLTLLQMDERTEIAVLEMGMSGRGEIELLSRLAEPDVAIITNIGEAHLLQLGSRIEIARAKTEIVAGLREGGLLIYNGDEPLIEQALSERPEAADEGRSRFGTFRFGAGPSNELKPMNIRMDGTSTRFEIDGLPGTAFAIPVLGVHNVINALAAAAAGKRFGVGAEAIARGLASAVMTGMRIEVSVAPNGVTVLNDAYNASPTSMRAALRLLEELDAKGRKYAALADMLELGPQEAELHREVGRSIDPAAVEAVLAYGPLGRHIAEGARERFPQDRVFHYDDKEALARELADRTEAGDAVLVKGSRGMRMETVAAYLLQLGGR